MNIPKKSKKQVPRIFLGRPLKVLKNRRPLNNRISLKNKKSFFCRPGMCLKKYSFLKTSCPELFRLNSQEDYIYIYIFYIYIYILYIIIYTHTIIYDTIHFQQATSEAPGQEVVSQGFWDKSHGHFASTLILERPAQLRLNPLNKPSRSIKYTFLCTCAHIFIYFCNVLYIYIYCI